MARLKRFKLRVKVEISLLGWRCVAVRGPGAEGVRTGGEWLRLYSSWPGINGFDLLGTDPVPPDGIPACGAEAWDAVRIEAGIPMMGSELDERVIPGEGGLVERSRQFHQRVLHGSGTCSRLDSRGSNVPRRLRGLIVRQVGRTRRSEPIQRSSRMARSLGG